MNSITEKIKQNHSLADLVTYKLGGAAEYFIAVEEKSELEQVFAWAKERKLPITILGGGSNVLIADTGVKGLVIHLDNQRLELIGDLLVVGAGVDVKAAAELALEKGLSGIEWSIGIPGSMGGAIRGNAGAHGGSFDRVVQSVTAFDSATLSWKELKPEQCGFEYRHSIFKEETDWLVWETTLQLRPGDKSEMEKIMEEYRAYRRNSQPKEPSCGCIFKNFYASELEKMNPAVVEMAKEDNKVRGGKVGAGYLIQKLGLMGTSRGGARISDQHANFIINADQATAKDVTDIIAIVKERVKKEYNVDLEEEVQYLGF